MDPVEIDEHLTNGHLKQLIMFTGLDLTNNPQHSTIYTGFANSRTDATPMVYRILTADHELITRKSSERQATLMKSVRGILKRSWPQKYLVERPALVVCFVDLDWDTSNWVEKKTECESKINSLRQSIGSREIRLCLVLVQKHATAHQNEKVASEKAAELCSQLRLQPKHLFIFPPCDSQSIGDCIARLERSFRDVVQEAYLVTLKKIRARSVPNNDLSLLVRQQFKQAFISELRQDTHSALRYYKSSYQHVSELEFTDTDVYEILSVGSLLNYKVCELAFLHNSAFDAVAQFRRHQHIFFDKELGTYPSRELAAIEFALWKSQQCRLFADLFEKAVSKGGLAAYPFQNPGRFLEESAAHYKMANWQIRQLKVKIGACQATPNRTTSPDPLQAFDTNPNNTTYFGQRPWRHKHDSPGGLADQVMEHAAKVYLEQNVQENYQRSLQLLSMAVQQFKRYNCEAMQQMAMVNMADDYANIHQFPKALQLLHHVATELRLRNFRQLLYAVLAKYMNIAYCMVNLTEYVWALVQLLNPNIKKSSLAGIENADESELEKCCKSFLLHRFSIPPCPIEAGQSGIEVGISQADVDLARTQWEQYYNHSLQVSFSVDMTRLESFVQCRARFSCTSDTTFAGDPLPIEVQLINLSNFSITFDKCLITIDEITIGVQAKTSSTLLEAHKTQFTLPATTESTESRHLYATLYPKLDGPNQRNKQIVIRKVALRIVGHGVSGSETNKANASFDWEMDNSSSRFPKANRLGDLNLDQGRTAVRVISQRRSGIILSSPSIPMSESTEIGLLLDEAVDIPFVLFNNEEGPLRNIRIVCHKVYKEDDQSSTSGTEGTLVPVYNQTVSEVLLTQQSANFSVRLSTKSTNCVGLQVQVTCLADNKDGEKDWTEFQKTFDVTCQEAFVSSTKTLSQNGDQLTALVRGQPAVLQTTIDMGHFSGNQHLTIHSIRWNLNNLLSEVDEQKENLIYSLEAKDKLQKWHMPADGTVEMSKFGNRICPQVTAVIPHTETEEIHGAVGDISLGDMIVEWKRPQSCEMVRSIMNLGQMSLITVPVIVTSEVILNQNGNNYQHNDEQIDEFERNAIQVRRPFTILFQLRNTHQKILPLAIELERSDVFVFSGYKEFSIRLIPGGVHTTEVTMAALAVGQLPFPKLNIKVKSNTTADDSTACDSLNQLIESHSFKCLPISLFVTVS